MLGKKLQIFDKTGVLLLFQRVLRTEKLIFGNITVHLDMTLKKIKGTASAQLDAGFMVRYCLTHLRLTLPTLSIQNLEGYNFYEMNT